MVRAWTKLWIGGAIAGAVVVSSSTAQPANPPAPAAPEVRAPASPGPRTVREVSPYADLRARAVGDILTIVIAERSSASNSSMLSTRRQTDFETRSPGGTGLFDFIPDFGMSATTGRDHEGRGESRQEGRLTARMAATVVAVRPNGDLEISGEREVAVNEEKETLVLTGVVRPIDVGSGNIVYSSDIANAKIAYKGKGQVSKGSHPNPIAWLFSWLF